MTNAPAIPSELLLPTPRAVRFSSRIGYGQKIKLSSYFIVPLLLTGVVVGEVVLLARAPVLSGRVTDYYYTFTHRSGHTLHVRYRFVDPAGQTIDAAGHVNGYYGDMRIGQRIDLRWVHIPGLSWSEPDLVYRNLFNERGEFWFAAALADLIALIACVIVRRQIWLMRYGQPIAGTVIARSRRARNGRGISVRVVYTPAERQLYRIVLGTHDFFKQVAEGDVVCVLFDPRDPHKSLVYEASGFECVGD